MHVRLQELGRSQKLFGDQTDTYSQARETLSHYNSHAKRFELTRNVDNAPGQSAFRVPGNAARSFLDDLELRSGANQQATDLLHQGIGERHRSQRRPLLAEVGYLLVFRKANEPVGTGLVLDGSCFRGQLVSPQPIDDQG